MREKNDKSLQHQIVSITNFVFENCLLLIFNKNNDPTGI